MTNPASQIDGEPQARAKGKSGARQAAAFVLGALLVSAAVWVVWSNRTDLQDAFNQARSARWWLIALLVSLPLVSWTLTSAMYWFLMNRDDRRGTRRHVALAEMHAVLASAWLMNYLPARPGLFGRLAYHKAVNDIPLGESVRASIFAIACGVGATLLIVGVALGASAAGLAGAESLTLAVAPAASGAAVALFAHRRETLRRSAWAFAARYADVLSWMARYFVIFHILGRPASLVEAAAYTAVSQAASMVPLIGNGLGIREWANGLVAPALPEWARHGSATAISNPLSLTVELIHRAAEVLAALPVGLACGAWVAARVRASMDRRS